MKDLAIFCLICGMFAILLKLDQLRVEQLTPKPPQCTCGPECEWVREATPRKDLR